MDENNNTFCYTYSPAQQEEVRRIREKYVPPEAREDKMARLRRLDASATRTARITAVAVGVLSVLVMGFGMCCTMLPEWPESLFAPGIGIGILGMTGVIAAWPLYVRMVRRKREKLAPEILRLTDELMR